MRELSVGTFDLAIPDGVGPHAAGVAHDLKVYPDAKQSFFNDRLRSYNPAAADSWQRVLAFFAEHDEREPAKG